MVDTSERSNSSASVSDADEGKTKVLDCRCLLSFVALEGGEKKVATGGVAAAGVATGVAGGIAGGGGGETKVAAAAAGDVSPNGDDAAAGIVAILTKSLMLPTLDTLPQGGPRGKALFVTPNDRFRISSSVAVTVTDVSLST
jgi:hypothetical protein